MQYYEEAAEQGDVKAQADLAYVLYKEYKLEEAKNWYKSERPGNTRGLTVVRYYILRSVNSQYYVVTVLGVVGPRL